MVKILLTRIKSITCAIKSKKSIRIWSCKNVLLICDGIVEIIKLQSTRLQVHNCLSKSGNKGNFFVLFLLFVILKVCFVAAECLRFKLFFNFFRVTSHYILFLSKIFNVLWKSPKSSNYFNSKLCNHSMLLSSNVTT